MHLQHLKWTTFSLVEQIQLLSSLFSFLPNLSSESWLSFIDSESPVTYIEDRLGANAEISVWKSYLQFQTSFNPNNKNLQFLKFFELWLFFSWKKTCAEFLIWETIYNSKTSYNPNFLFAKICFFLRFLSETISMISKLL